MSGSRLGRPRRVDDDTVLAAVLATYQRWATDQLRSQVAATVDDTTQPPLDALHRLVRASAGPIERPDHLVNAMSVYTDAADPGIRELTAERLELGVGHTATLLDRAVADGSLGGIDARRLAEHLQRCLIGTCLTWSMTTPQRPLADELTAVTDLVLAPYLRVPEPSTEEES